eukprot:TRINITY_DN15444_c0_g1_i1.p1 TRINITY_DN15444_c0_g1~~TRINITY_DN15444_c0_g1_i1.p1  ORF type:complete len:871 (+),score=217.89 TRINITY_DN15444_c0_g1_i1:83-2695(+)
MCEALPGASLVLLPLLLHASTATASGVPAVDPFAGLCPAVHGCDEGTAPAPSAESEHRSRLPALAAYASALLCCSLACFLLREVARRRAGSLWGSVHRAADLAAYCTLWFSVSISFTLFNKWMFHFWMDGTFCFPIVVTLVHMTTKGLIAAAYVHGARRCSPERPRVPPAPPAAVDEAEGARRDAAAEPVELTPRQWLLRACPVGAATALDIALSNWSFVYIDVSFYTIVKTSVLVWTFFFSLVLQLQRLTAKLAGAVGIIVVGIALASYGEGTCFNLTGFMLAGVASVLAGFRWALTEVLLRSVTDKSTLGGAFQAVYWFSPAAAITMVPVYIPKEAEGLSQWSDAAGEDAVFEARLLTLAGGTCACLLIVAELAVVARASALTLGVAGYIKEILTILFSILVFGDHFTLMNGSGLLLALAGTALYTQAKMEAGGGYRQLNEVPPTSTPPSAGPLEGRAPASRLVHFVEPSGVLSVARPSPLQPTATYGTTRHGLVWAEAHMRGRRPQMEDAHCIGEISARDKGWDFFGVYDGHGDRGVVSHAVATGEGIKGVSLCHAVSESEAWRAGDVAAALRQAILRTDSRLRRGLPPPADGGPNAWDHGCCVCAALGAAGEVWLCNLGDSQAVVYSPTFEVLRTTRMHKPGDSDEHRRIRACGGAVIDMSGCPRVTLADGSSDSFLAVARALGDHRLKPAVGNEPEVIHSGRLLRDGGWLLVACDGVWDAPMHPGEAGRRLSKLITLAAEVAAGTETAVDDQTGPLRARFQEWGVLGADEALQAAAALRVLVASAVGSYDNVSAILVKIPPHPATHADAAGPAEGAARPPALAHPRVGGAAAHVPESPGIKIEMDQFNRTGSPDPGGEAAGGSAD